MTILTDTFANAPALTTRFANLRERLAESAAKRKVYRTTLRELQNLTPRELNDLGIAPTMITKIAHEAAYGA